MHCVWCRSVFTFTIQLAITQEVPVHLLQDPEQTVVVPDLIRGRVCVLHSTSSEQLDALTDQVRWRHCTS